MMRVEEYRCKKVLVAEDDEMLSRFLERLLQAEGYLVQFAQTGTTVLQCLEAPIDLLLLDLNLPELDGLAVLERVRQQNKKLPVLVLTARGRADGMLPALDAGADDCLLKPFSYLELTARVRALLRRSEGPAANANRCADLTLDRETMQVKRGGRRLELTQREFSLLECLMRTPDVPVSRAVLLKEVWGGSCEPSTNVVDVYMKYVRDKIDSPDQPKLVHTVRGTGYMLSAT